MDRLKDKVAVVTGAAGGIGVAIAKLFAQEGARVIATDVQEEKLKGWVQEEKAGGLALDYMLLDVTSETGWRTVVDATLFRYNSLDVLVNNAGVYPGFVSCEGTSKALWDKIIAINLTGPFLGCKACIPHMRHSGGGAIVNVASIAGWVGGNGVAYSSSKGGLRLMTKDLAIALAPDKIWANTLCPGAVRTPMTEAMLADPQMDKMIKNLSPQGRVADAVEIAEAAVYLASDESSFMTGADMVLDGGLVAR